MFYLLFYFCFPIRHAPGGSTPGSYTAGQSDKQILSEYKGRLGLSPCCTIINIPDIHVLSYFCVYLCM